MASIGILPLRFPVGCLLHPGAAELPADPGQGGVRAAGGLGPPVRGVPPQTAGGAAAPPGALLKPRAPLPPGGLYRGGLTGGTRGVTLGGPRREEERTEV